MARSSARLPPGHPPWDTINGFRVGGFAGALLGAIPAVIVGGLAVWLIPIGAVVGGAIGYWTERRKQRLPPSEDRTHPT
jgi:hypothetical protein